jgi:hypothetical protein
LRCSFVLFSTLCTRNSYILICNFTHGRRECRLLLGECGVWQRVRRQREASRLGSGVQGINVCDGRMLLRCWNVSS